MFTVMIGSSYPRSESQLHILTKFLDFSVPWFPDLYNVTDHSTCLTRLLGQSLAPTICVHP